VASLALEVQTLFPRGADGMLVSGEVNRASNGSTALSGGLCTDHGTERRLRG
jgi:hypothetical protein